MKRRMKQITAFICATIMAVSGCLIDGVIVSRADETSAEGSGPVIKFNNPGIGADVGETIDLAQYAVQFADGVTTDAADVKWITQKELKVIKFRSPAIGVNEGDAVDLTEYAVEFEDGIATPVATWKNGDEEIVSLTPEKGVYQLKAIAADGMEKEIYVVAKGADEDKYVLYRNDFETTSDIESTVDFVNNDTPQYLTQLRTKKAHSDYKIVSMGTENDAKGVSFERYEKTNGTGVSEVNSLNMHLLLPNWLGEFGNYNIEMQAKFIDSTSYKTSDGHLAFDIRTQFDYDGADATESELTPNNYLYSTYCVKLRNNTNRNYATDISKESSAGCVGSSGATYVSGKANDENYTLDLFSNFIFSARVDDNTFGAKVKQGEVEFPEVSKTIDDWSPKIGRIGIWAYLLAPRVDYVEVCLVDAEQETVVADIELDTFTPDTNGVYELTAKTGTTTKTIYIIAKNPEDTEYVMWENNFDTAEDAPYYDMGTTNDYDGFGRLYGSGSYSVNEETGRLEITTGSSRSHLRFPKWIGEFGNYSIQMTEKTSAYSSENQQIGLFARGRETKNYTPNYTVLLRYKGFASDSIALKERNEWVDDNTKLSYGADIVWGKVLNRSPLKPENEYVHELFVQDDLIDYKVNGITRLYDVRNRDLKTGHVGILIESGITISLDSVRVLFVPDISAPEKPISATYGRTTSTLGMADGKVTVKLSAEGDDARDVLCYWGDGTKELEGYTHFGKTAVEEGATSVIVNLGTNIMIPEGATEFRIYTENNAGRSADCVVVPLQESLNPLSRGEEIVSFQVISDTHITTKADGYASLNFKKFLTDLTTNDPDSIGIFVGGDLVDKGKQEEYDTLKNIWKGVETETGKTLPGMHAVIGNHEFWTKKTYEETVALFNQNTGREGEETLYYAEEVDGYHFIYLASSKLTASYTSHTNAELGDVQLQWFEEQMQNRAEDGKPIFVFLHQPLQETVTGAGDDSVKEHEELKAILAKYPQTFFFTSHSHMNLDTPGTMVSAEEGVCNMFNTSAISYLMNTHYTSKTITSDGAQAYYVEVYKDKVLVRGKDVVTDLWLPSAQFVVSLNDNNDSAFEIEIGGTDVSYLDNSFDVYQYQKPTTKEKTYAVTGPVKPSDGYYTTEYTGTSAKGGLKPTSIPGGNKNSNGGYSALAYKKSEMKNFVAEYEFFGGDSAVTGLAFGGSEGRFPISLDGKSNETGVILYMTNNGYLYVAGAIDTNKDNIKKPSDVNIYTDAPGQENYLSSVPFIRVTKLVLGDDGKTLGLDVVKTNLTDESPTRTICVKVQNGTLTIYDKEHTDRVLEIPLTSAYDGGYVSLISNRVDQGAFKRFNIQELQEWDYDMKVKLQGTSVSYLDDAFDVYQYKSPTSKTNAVATLGPVNPSDTYEEDGKTYTYFTTLSHGQYANGGLKPTSIGGGESVGYTALTYTKDTVKDFELEYDFYPGHGINGLIIGGKINTLPMTLNTTDTAGEDIGIGIRVENTGHLSVWGVIDATAENIVTSNSAIKVNVAPSSDYSYMNNATAKVRISGMTGEELNKSVTLLKEDTDYYTICVKMKDGVLTIYEKDHPNRVVSIPVVTTRYKGGYVSLISNTEQSGAFGGFRISKISEGYDFRYYSMEELEPYFDSYYFAADAEGVKGETISEQWYKTQDNQTMGTLAIKPVHKNKDEQSSILTLKDSNVKNFHATAEYYTSYVSCGIVVAPEGQLASKKSGVQVYINGDGKLFIEGAIDASTGVWSGTGDSVNGTNKVTSPELEGYVKPSTTNDAYKTRYFLNVRVQDGVLTAYVEGFEGELSVKLTGDYEGGKVSLYSKGYDQGGFWQFELQTLDVLPVARTNFPFELTSEGDFVKIEVSTDAVYSKLIGSLKYDASKFEFVSAEIADETLNADVLVEANEGTIPLTMLINNNGGNDKLVTMYFKELVDTLDFTSFYVDDYDVLASGGISAKRVDSPVDVEYDHTEDKVIDVLDIIRGKKNSTEEVTVDVAPIRRLLLGKSIYSSSVSGAVVIEEDVTVNAGDTLGTEGATTIYRNCEIDFSSFTAATDVELVGSVVLDGVTVTGANQANVFANGYEFKVNDNTKFVDSLRRLYGGKYGEQTFTTNLTLLGGQYTYIYAGASSANVMGDTHITLGGNAEATRVLGGGYQGETLGNTYVTIKDNVKITEAYGGGYQNATVQGSCYVNFLGGDVKNLYGGGRQADVNGNTYVVVGGTANADINVADHDHLTNLIYGGGDGSANTAIVKGNTYVTVQDSAQAHVVYGGGYGQQSEVQGACHVEINGGYVMGYYGGSRSKGEVYETNVTMNGGVTEQIFGGCDRYSMLGNVNVIVTGGEVQRRIYGGCYNDYLTSLDNWGWQSDYFVTGNIIVTISGINYTHSQSNGDYALCAVSRSQSDHEEEIATIKITQNLYDSYRKYVDSPDMASKGYDYKEIIN